MQSALQGLLRIFAASIILLLPSGGFPFFGAKHEPPDGNIYHCAQGEVRPLSMEKLRVDWSGIREYAATCGRQPKLIMHYISFDERAFDILQQTIVEITRRDYSYVPQIGLDFYTYSETPSLLNATDITQKIAVGEYDRHIGQLARLFRSMNSPVFLRPGYEFGGSGQGSRASKKYWIRAWRRVHDIFQQERAANVAFVWNTLDARDFMDYYPGDSYVDWWAINIFINNSDDDPFIADFITQAAQHRKPVMVAESTPRYIGSTGGEISWQQWYQPYFNLLLRYPHVKAFCYINASWEDYPDRSFAHDCRIQKNKLVSERYRHMLMDARFLSADEK